MTRDDAKKRESIVRKKLFRATAGLSLSEQSNVASAMAMNNNNVLETIQKMQSKSKKLSTKQSTQKFEWLRDNSHLRKLEEAAMKELDNALLKILNEAVSNTPAKRGKLLCSSNLRTSEQTRRRESLIESAKAAISSAKEAADKEKLRSEEMTQRLADQELLHAKKLTPSSGKRSAQADVAAHQAEIARLEAEAVIQAAERKRQKEHELKKKLLQTHKDWQQVEKLAQEQAEAERIAAEAEAQRQLDAINATRVAFRTEVYEQKCELQKQKAIQKVQEEAEKEKILEAIKQEAPYAEKIAQIEADPNRTRQATVAFKANVEAAQEGLGIHETGLFPSHGYDTDKLFKDARFKLGLALRVT
ncbi:unnamed protein product [Aphanomyces euteiches]